MQIKVIFIRKVSHLDSFQNRSTREHSFFFSRIYFIRISRLTFVKFYEYFKNKAKAEILKSIDIILC